MEETLEKRESEEWCFLASFEEKGKEKKKKARGKDREIESFMDINLFVCKEDGKIFN